MSAVTPKIETRFSLAGIREAVASFGRIRDTARTSLSDVKKNASEALRPMEKDVERLRRSLRLLRTAGVGGATLGLRGMFQGVKYGAVGAAAAVAGIAAQWTAVSTATIQASRDAAKYGDEMAKRARALGMSPEDLSVIGYAAEQVGAPAEEAAKGIAKVSSGFLDVRQRIQRANEEFARFRAIARDDAILSLASGRADGITAAGDGVASARVRSLAGIDERLSQLRQMLAQADVIRSGGGRPSVQEATRTHGIRKEISELTRAREELQRSFGPMGEALFGLEGFGLDIDRATKGGVESFLAVGDAIRRVEDPVQRLRYSVLLFGEDAGPKLMNLLMSGSDGMRKYREEAEALGIVVSDEMARMSEEYETAARRFARSRQGLRVSIGQLFLPEMTQASNAMTDLVIQHRQRLAQMLKASVQSVRALGLDMWDIFHGRRENLRTGWLQSVVIWIDEARRLWSIFKDDVRSLAAGGNARWPWLDALGKGLIAAIDLVQDLWRIFRGGDAVRFEWLNDLRDSLIEIYDGAREWILWFAEKLEAALDMFSGVLSFIRDNFLQPLADLFGTDITTMALFLGLMKISGILGIILKTVGLIVRGLAGLAIPGLAAAGAPGLAAGLAGMAGIGGLGGGGPAGQAGRGGRLAQGLRGAGNVGLAAAGIYGSWEAGKALGEYTYENSEIRELNRLVEQFNLERIRRDGAMGQDRMHRNRMRADRTYRSAYWAERDIHVADTSRYGQEQARMRARDLWGTGGKDGFTMDGQSTAEVIRIELDIAGEEATGIFAPSDAKRLAKAAADTARRTR